MAIDLFGQAEKPDMEENAEAPFKKRRVLDMH